MKNPLKIVRGWFPKEPYLISTRVKVDSETKQQSLVIPPGYDVSATKFAGASAIFWIIFYGFMTFTSLDLERYPISAFQVVAWIIAGLTVGTITGAMFTKNQLARLSKDYQFFLNGKDMVLLLVPTILFFIFGVFVSWFFPSGLHVPHFQGLLISLYAWGISIEITRIVLFYAFEKRENMRLMQSWLGMGIFLIPKAPKQQVLQN